MLRYPCRRELRSDLCQEPFSNGQSAMCSPNVLKDIDVQFLELPTEYMSDILLQPANSSSVRHCISFPAATGGKREPSLFPVAQAVAQRKHVLQGRDSNFSLAASAAPSSTFRFICQTKVRHDRFGEGEGL